MEMNSKEMQMCMKYIEELTFIRNQKSDFPKESMIMSKYLTSNHDNIQLVYVLDFLLALKQDGTM